MATDIYLCNTDQPRIIWDANKKSTQTQMPFILGTKLVNLQKEIAHFPKEITGGVATKYIGEFHHSNV